MTAPACEHPNSATDLHFAALLRPLAPAIHEMLLAMAARGGGPGRGCVVLTDGRNAPWFYPPGDPAAASIVANHTLDEPVALGREIDAACPACGRALRQVPRNHVALYVRIGATAEAFTASWPFPAELAELARRAPEKHEGTALVVDSRVVKRFRGRRR